MIQGLLNQVITIRSIRKIFMKKRDVRIYDRSWKNVSELLTEYDVDIFARMIRPNEWRQLMDLEKEFDIKYPNCIFKYNLIESDSNVTPQNAGSDGKLIYDSETIQD